MNHALLSGDLFSDRRLTTDYPPLPNRSALSETSDIRLISSVPSVPSMVVNSSSGISFTHFVKRRVLAQREPFLVIASKITPSVQALVDEGYQIELAAPCKQASRQYNTLYCETGLARLRERSEFHLAFRMMARSLTDEGIAFVHYPEVRDSTITPHGVASIARNSFEQVVRIAGTRSWPLWQVSRKRSG
ncbi:MAG TPA: hypothetical protein V6D07_18790 [Trichocoleus sp.]